MKKLSTQEFVEFCLDQNLTEFIIDTGSFAGMLNVGTISINRIIEDVQVYSNNPDQIAFVTELGTIKFCNVKTVLMEELAPCGYLFYIVCSVNSNHRYAYQLLARQSTECSRHLHLLHSVQYV